MKDIDIIEDKLNRLAKLEADIAPLNRLLEAVAMDNDFIIKLRETESNAEWRRKIFMKLREIKKNEAGK